eukprot:TRINITY_DN3568_c0_g1_i1.p2 TRINITY_DN3568_c0_g1~~TRINITY_DN3568_c0_g1_i1.p2  ORF type:complete len:75 (+),score=17.74 TRINITY_DN3568_c0_g1_i1:267-491(+)
MLCGWGKRTPGVFDQFCLRKYEFKGFLSISFIRSNKTRTFPWVWQKINQGRTPLPHVLCVDTGRSSETAKAHRG